MSGKRASDGPFSPASRKKILDEDSDSSVEIISEKIVQKRSDNDSVDSTSDREETENDRRIQANAHLQKTLARLKQEDGYCVPAEKSTENFDDSSAAIPQMKRDYLNSIVDVSPYKCEFTNTLDKIEVDVLLGMKEPSGEVAVGPITFETESILPNTHLSVYVDTEKQGTGRNIRCDSLGAWGKYTQDSIYLDENGNRTTKENGQYLVNKLRYGRHPANMNILKNVIFAKSRVEEEWVNGPIGIVTYRFTADYNGHAVPTHGNSKRKGPFTPRTQNTLDEVRVLRDNKRPSRVVGDIAGEILSGKRRVSEAVDSQHVHNAGRGRSVKHGTTQVAPADVDELRKMSGEKFFIRDISTDNGFRMFCATESGLLTMKMSSVMAVKELEEVKKRCSFPETGDIMELERNSQEGSPIFPVYIDGLHSFPDRYTTIVSTRSNAVVCTSARGEPHPLLPCCFFFSTTRTEEDYRWFLSRLDYALNLNKGEVFRSVVTDGEPALCAAIDKSSLFHGSYVGRCELHAKKNVEFEAKDKGIVAENVQKFNHALYGGEKIIDRESGRIRVEGIIDAPPETRKQKVDALIEAIASTSASKHYLQKKANEAIRFASVENRSGIGLGVSRVTNNAAEAVNAQIKKRLQEWVKKGSPLDIIVRELENEIEAMYNPIGLSIMNQSLGFRPSDFVGNVTVSEKRFRAMTRKEQMKCLAKVGAAPVQIARALQDSEKMSVPRVIRNRVPDCDKLIELGIKKCNDVVTFPQNGKRKDYAVREDGADVKTVRSDPWECNCVDYKKTRLLCVHIVAAAGDNTQEVLNQIASELERKKATDIDKESNCAMGSKGGVPRRGSALSSRHQNRSIQGTSKPPEPHQPVRFQYIGDRMEERDWMEDWVNNEYIVVESVPNHSSKDTVCVSCSAVIPKRRGPPYDFCFSHKERYEYNKKNDDGEWTKQITHKLMQKKYVHASLSCLKKRYGYVLEEGADFLRVDLSLNMTDARLNVLRKIGFELIKD